MPKSRDLNPGTASCSRNSRTCKAASDKNSKIGSVSKYFTRNKNDETTSNNLRSSESIAGEDSTPRNLRKIRTVILSDDDDFQSPKPTKKLARIFTNPTEPQANKKITKRVFQKGKRGTKKDSLQKTIEDAFKKRDVHAEHLQMAIALSVSAQEAQRAEEEKEISQDQDYEPVAASSQEVRENVRKTLEQYGFRSSGGKEGSSEWSGFFKNTEVSKRKKKSRYQYVKPILFLRTDATRNEMINSRIAQILVESSTEQGNIQEIQEYNPQRMDELNPQELQKNNPKRSQEIILHSKNLTEIHYKNNDFITRNNRPLNELTKNKFYVEKLNLSPSKHECGCLLKKWEEIPGREPSPARNKMSENEEQFESSLKSTEISQKLTISQRNPFENIQSEMKDGENNSGVNEHFNQSIMKETKIICGVKESLDRNEMEENENIKENKKILENEENVRSNVEINRLNQSNEKKVEINEFTTTESLFRNNEENKRISNQGELKGNKNVDAIEKSFNKSMKEDKEFFFQNTRECLNGNKTIELNNADVECEISAEETIEIFEECKASSRLLSTKSSPDINQQSNRVTNATNSITHQPISSRKKIRSHSPDLFDTDEDSFMVDGENVHAIQIENHENIPTTIQIEGNGFVDVKEGEHETPGILMKSETQNERTIPEGNVTLTNTETLNERAFPKTNVKPAGSEFFNNRPKTSENNQEFEASQKKLPFLPIKKSLDEEEPPAKKRRTLENIFSASLLSNLHGSSSEEISDCELIESDKGILHFESFHTEAADHTIEIVSSDKEEEFKFKGEEAHNRGSIKNQENILREENEYGLDCESKKESDEDDIFNDATMDADFFDYRAVEFSEHDGDEDYKKDDHNFPDKNGSLVSANTSFGSVYVSDEELNYSSALSKTMRNNQSRGDEILSEEESFSSPERENNKPVSYSSESADEDVEIKEDSASSLEKKSNQDFKNKESSVFPPGGEITNDVSISIESSSEDENIKESSVFSRKNNELVNKSGKPLTQTMVEVDLDLQKKADYNNSPFDSTLNTEEIASQWESGNQGFKLNCTNQDQNTEASSNLKGEKKRSRFEESDSESEDNETKDISMATLLKRLEFEFTERNNCMGLNHSISREELSDDDVIEIVDEKENTPQQLSIESQSGEKTLEQTRIECNENDDDIEISREDLSEKNASDGHVVEMENLLQQSRIKSQNNEDRKNERNNIGEKEIPPDLIKKSRISFDSNKNLECGRIKKDKRFENVADDSMSTQSNIGCKSDISESDNEIVKTAEREPFVDNSIMLDNLNDDYHPGDEDSIGFHMQPQVFNFVEDETAKISEDKIKLPLRIIEEIDLCSNSNSPKHQVVGCNEGVLKDEMIFDEDTIDYIPKETHFSAGSSVLGKSDRGLRANSFFEDTFANLLEQTGVIDAIDANIGQNSNNANIRQDRENDSEKIGEFSQRSKASKENSLSIERVFMKDSELLPMKKVAANNCEFSRIESCQQEDEIHFSMKDSEFPPIKNAAVKNSSILTTEMTESFMQGSEIRLCVEDLEFSAVKNISNSVKMIGLKNSSSEEGKIFNMKNSKIFGSINLSSTPGKLPTIHTEEIEAKIINKNGCYETPNKKIVVRTRNVTPIPDYDSMNTPQLHKEFSRFGLKKMKRKRGIDMLKYIYESTHPVLNYNTGSRCKRRKLSLDEEFTKNSGEEECVVYLDKENVGSEKKSTAVKENFQRDLRFENPPLKIECIGDTVNLGEREDEMIFERTRSKRIHSCQLPLHIAFHNLLSANPSIRENVLLYEPLQVEVLYGMLKENGLKYNIQDLISFLDRKCITIRMNQN